MRCLKLLSVFDSILLIIALHSFLIHIQNRQRCKTSKKVLSGSVRSEEHINTNRHLSDVKKTKLSFVLFLVHICLLFFMH